jgi:hypothetical protein
MTTARRATKGNKAPRRLTAGSAGFRTSGRCTARSASGEPCKAHPLHGRKHCAFHSGDNASVCGQRGGRRRAIFDPEGLEPMKAPRNAADLLVMLSQTIVEVRSAKIDTRAANSIAYLGASFLRAIEVANLDVRLRVLEGKT